MFAFFYHLPHNARQCFSRRYLPFHALACGLTYVLTISGFDGWYFSFFLNSLTKTILFPAVVLGFFVPIFSPFILWIVGALKKNTRLATTGFALGQAGFVGLMLSFLYKALTGRAHPSTLTDMSQVFNFGFLRGGVFWGWPSSHTTVAFAVGLTLYTLYPDKKWVRYLALSYAFYIGLGISMSIHWFSDFVAGAIFGSLVGIIVGRTFYQKIATAGSSGTNEIG